MKVIVGLGNPGKKYVNTPHNIGFAVVDALANGALSCGLKNSLRFKAKIGEGRLGAESCLLVQPATFMNLSGLAVGSILRYRKVTHEDLIVVLDDADLEFGRLRIKSSGGSGGHKGLASVAEHVSSDRFVRVRIGIGRDVGRGGLVNHVLRPFKSVERKGVDAAVERAADAVICVLRAGVDTAMNEFNGVC